jgi:rhamnose transport system permease protein
MNAANLKRNLSGLVRPELSIFVFFILSLVVGTAMSPYFLDLNYLLSSTTMYTELGIIALPFTYLMIAGEIDLSVASTMSLVACICATLFKLGVPMMAVIPIGVVIGFLLGLLNGIIVTTTGLSSLIITIGTMCLYSGIAQVLIGDSSISGFPNWFNGLDTHKLFGIFPVSLLFFLAMAVVLELILRFTFLGRKIYAVGNNHKVSEYSAVNVKKIKAILFGLVGMCAGIAGLMCMSRLEIARFDIGNGGELDVITMVFLGGTAFSGGSGNILGTTLAFFVLMLVKTSMLLININNFDQLAIIGILLIVVLIISDKLTHYANARHNI